MCNGDESPVTGKAEICMNEMQLEEVSSLKYLGATLSKDASCTSDTRIRIATATAAMARMDRISNSIGFTSGLPGTDCASPSYLPSYGHETWRYGENKPGVASLNILDGGQNQ